MTICLELNDNLMRQALQISGLTTETETVEAALRLFIASGTQPGSENQLPKRLPIDLLDTTVRGTYKDGEAVTLPDESAAMTSTIDWINEPFLGMWKNRDEMKDRVAWVKELRRNEWTRFK